MVHPKEDKLLAVAEGFARLEQEDDEPLSEEAKAAIHKSVKKFLPLWNQLMPLIVADIVKAIKHGKGPEDGF
jgi:hypothetical protein